MTGARPRVAAGISLGGAVAIFSLAEMFSPAAAMPMSIATVHAAQAGVSQVEKVQVVVGRRRGWGRRRVCFWRFGRRVCVWR